MFSSPAAVLTVLTGVAAFFFWLERATQWKFFNFVPPLIFIYAVPVALNNLGVIPAASPAYDVLRDFGLPVFITLLLLGVNVGAAVRVMGKGVFVMLLGTAGIVIGAPIGYAVASPWLPPEAWKGFGALAGSWIGGTGNMAAVAGGLETPPEMFGLAVLADNVIYVIWLPILLASKALAGEAVLDALRRHAASSSRAACARASSVTVAPDSIRAISSRRSASVSLRT